MTGQLVTTNTADSLLLSGFLTEGDKQKPVVLYIHGWCGDFFSNPYIPVLATELSKIGSAFLSVQTRGMGNKYSVSVPEGHKIIGGEYELLEEAHLDISAWVQFLKTAGYQKIVLMGHSLGTHKIVRAALECENAADIGGLILLSPFDKMFLLEKASPGQRDMHLEIAQKMIAEKRGEEMIPTDWCFFQVSYQTFLSSYGENDFTHMFDFSKENYQFPVLKKITIPTHVIVGSQDEYFYQSNPMHPEEAMNMLLKNLADSSGKIIVGAKHRYVGHEQEVAQEVIHFLERV